MPLAAKKIAFGVATIERRRAQQDQCWRCPHRAAPTKTRPASPTSRPAPANTRSGLASPPAGGADQKKPRTASPRPSSGADETRQERRRHVQAAAPNQARDGCSSEGGRSQEFATGVASIGQRRPKPRAGPASPPVGGVNPSKTAVTSEGGRGNQGQRRPLQAALTTTSTSPAHAGGEYMIIRIGVATIARRRTKQETPRRPHLRGCRRRRAPRTTVRPRSNDQAVLLVHQSPKSNQEQSKLSPPRQGELQGKDQETTAVAPTRVDVAPTNSGMLVIRRAAARQRRLCDNPLVDCYVLPRVGGSNVSPHHQSRRTMHSRTSSCEGVLILAHNGQ